MTPALYCVANHHKGGTVWMKQVFRAFAKSNSVTIQAPEGENATNAPLKIEVTSVASVENAVRPAQGGHRILALVGHPSSIGAT